jgi:signal transduction histidine kinase
LTPEIDELFYRSAQEAVRNVMKHAHASTVTIEIRVDHGRAALEVRDDGRGFRKPNDPSRPRFGLRLLAEVAFRLDGRLEIDSVPGEGTTVHVEVPVP